MSIPAPDGLVVVDKPPGMTSHDVVARTRRLARTRKVGHAGTLDPMATGVLLLGLGKATRLLGHLALATKAYDATIRLGQTTVTDDAEGELVDSRDASGIGDAAIAVVMTRLTGDILQVPSAVSAIKVNGKRSYARVRAGEDVELEPRPVTVSAFTVSGFRRGEGVIDLDVHVECSTGTYVRALARDLGAALEVGGHLTALRRTRVGSFDISHTHTLEDLEGADRAEGEAFDAAVVPLADVAAAMFPTYAVAADLVSAVRNGRPLLTTRISAASEAPAAREPESDLLAVMGPDGEFLALYRRDGDSAKPVAVFASA